MIMYSFGRYLAQTVHDHEGRPLSQSSARTLTDSEHDWVTVRSYLIAHRYDLSVDASADFAPASRVAGTPLLAARGWRPTAPIPLRGIGLELSDAGSAEAEHEVPSSLLPRRPDGTRYRRYSRRWANWPPRWCSRTAQPIG